MSTISFSFLVEYTFVMPELPEVQTTVNGLNSTVKGATIVDVWTDLAIKNHPIKHYSATIKNEVFYKKFKKEVTGAKILGARRRAKNILIDLNPVKSQGDHGASRKTIIVHMKMTGHLLFGEYTEKQVKSGKLKAKSWVPKDKSEENPLNDSFNKFIHVVFTLKVPKVKHNMHLAFSDARKFGTVTLVDTSHTHKEDFKNLGPEPLDAAFTYEVMRERLNKKKSGKIKTVLMDQSVISGIGNIYSDEMLWLAGINPLEQIKDITEKQFKLLYPAMKRVLEAGIDFGGDSTSDYRQIDGTHGEFHHHHNAYQHTGQKCAKRGCIGVIIRTIVGGRSAHYCSVHQRLNHVRRP